MKFEPQSDGMIRLVPELPQTNRTAADRKNGSTAYALSDATQDGRAYKESSDSNCQKFMFRHSRADPQTGYPPHSMFRSNDTESLP